MPDANNAPPTQLQDTAAHLPWREKLSSALVPILLTALGAIGFQSAKYVAIDYWKEEGAAIAQREQSRRDIEKWLAYEKAFHEIADKVQARNQERSTLIMSNVPPNAKVGSSYKKFSKVLFDAYGDLGAVSYAPTFDHEMESLRKIITEETQATIDGLEILTDLSFTKPALSLGGRLKVANALERTNRRFYSALSGAVSVYRSNSLADESKDAEWKLQREKASQEHKSRDFWFLLRLGLTAISALAWIELVFSLGPKKEKKSKTKKQAVSASAT